MLRFDPLNPLFIEIYSPFGQNLYVVCNHLARRMLLVVLGTLATHVAHRINHLLLRPVQILVFAIW